MRKVLYAVLLSLFTLTISAQVALKTEGQDPKYVETIKGRFSRGRINIDKPSKKLQRKYRNQEDLWDFIEWYRKQK